MQTGFIPCEYCNNLIRVNNYYNHVFYCEHNNSDINIENVMTNVFTNVSDIGASLLGVNTNRTESESNPSEQLYEIVEGWQGVHPSSVKNAVTVNNHDNTVPGSNQYSCTRTFNNQHCVQGLEVNAPNGGEYSNFTEF